MGIEFTSWEPFGFSITKMLPHSHASIANTLATDTAVTSGHIGFVGISCRVPWAAHVGAAVDPYKTGTNNAKPAHRSGLEQHHC